MMDPQDTLRQTTSPLRIPKRDHAAALARRTSSSYRHVRNNNLVSNSPFKAFVSTPSPRRVSGEKRPRPLSIVEQAEEERTFVYKRERRQSRGFQGLVKKEPVSKSPFKHPTPTPPVLPSTHEVVTAYIHTIPPELSATEPVAFPTEDVPRPVSSHAHPSPARSSLVTRRLHGPRVSGSSRDSFGRRHRRKRVTFHEKCDVVEFEPDSDSETFSEPYATTRDGVDDDDDDYEFFSDPGPPLGDELVDDFFDDVPLDTDHPISIEAMLQATQYSASSPPVSASSDLPLSSFSHPNSRRSPSSSPHSNLVRQELAKDDERDDSYEGQLELDSVEFILQSSFSKHSESTPPPRSLLPSSVNPVTSIESKIPVRKSIYAERRRATPKLPNTESGIEHAVGMLPPSPSPKKSTRRTTAVTTDTPLLPQLEKSFAENPIALEEQILHSRQLPQIKDELPLDLAFLSRSNDSVDAAELSINDSAHSVEVPLEPKDSEVQIQPIPELVAPSEEDTSISSCESRDFVAGDVDPVHSTPQRESFSSSLNGSLENLTGHLRITKTDVQKRLLNKRSGNDDSGDDDAVEDKDRKSETTSLLTDGSAENATIETVERRVLSPITHDKSTTVEAPSFLQKPGPSLDFDFGSRFGRGLGVKLEDFVASGVSELGTRSDLPVLDMNVEMRSALDRLVEDFAGGVDGRHRRGALQETPDESMTTSLAEDSMVTEERAGATLKPCAKIASIPLERAATDSELLPGRTAGPSLVSAPSRTASVSSIPPPPPPKDAIRAREELVLGKRRQIRQAEEDESKGYYTPRIAGDRRGPAHVLAMGRPSRRRSRSTGDIELLNDAARKRETLLDVTPFTTEEDPLADSIDRELRKLHRNPTKKMKYAVRQHEEMIYASSDADKVSHMNTAGDVDSGKAWRAVRRPSDMNEYSKQIKEFRAQEKPGKTHGKVFVKVLGIKSINVPMPEGATWFTCTLNNGIHFVTTPECRLGVDCRVEQEFELIEHSKLEFTLTLKVKRDPHIIALFKTLGQSPVSAPAPQAPAPSRGMRSFFMSSPKKKEKPQSQLAGPQAAQRLRENLAWYLKPDGTLARCFISFKDVASRCDTRLFETSFPLIGQKTEAGNTMSTLQVGEIVLQLFRLPPIPGLPTNQLPQSLEECHRGLRHLNWHKVTYFEGTLTQNGGDCMSWRRRRFRIIGAKLVAFNDVTRKATATIDLRKAIAVEDDQEMRENLLSPDSQKTARSVFVEEYDGLAGVERSFRLKFPRDEEILFFADTDAEKAKWLEVLRVLVGHIPPHPLWAELLWERQNEGSKNQRTLKPPQ